MATEFEKALGLKCDRHFSDVKCFMEFKNEKVVLYYGKEEIHNFNNLHDMNEWLAAKHKRFHVYTNNFDLIWKAYEKQIIFYRKRYKIQILMVGTKVYGLNLFNIVSFKDMKYKFGSDKFSAAAAIEIICKDKTSNKSSFTSNLGRLIDIDSIRQKFQPIPLSLREKMMNETPNGAIILANVGKEFTNVHCYDVCSAYLACLLEGRIPSKFIKVDKRQKNQEYYGRIKYKNLKAKNPQMLVLYGTKKMEGSNIVQVGSRVLAAEEYSFYCFLNERWIIDQYYTYDSCEIDYDNLYWIQFEKLPLSSIKAIKKLYDDKLAAKGQLDYDGFKQIVNRIYGFFTTKRINKEGKVVARDYQIPYQIGIWIVHKQRLFMAALIQQVGIEHVVSAHTDGVKFDCNADEIVDKVNLRRGEIYKDVGQWKKEEIFDKCFYFSNTVAKYEVDGTVGMKHGGIAEEDVNEFLHNKTYEDINRDVEFYITLPSTKRVVCEKDKTYISKRKVLSNILLMEDDSNGMEKSF